MRIGLRGDRAEVRIRHVLSYRQRRSGSGFGYNTTHYGPVAVFKLERPQGEDAERVVTCPHCGSDVAVEVQSAAGARRHVRILVAVGAIAAAVSAVCVGVLLGLPQEDPGEVQGRWNVALGTVAAVGGVVCAFAVAHWWTEKGAKLVRERASYAHPQRQELPAEDQFHVQE